MIKINDEQLRQIQLVELDLLMEVDRICRECGIQYNIIAGTLLGAVRHGGFIPWDDDADIAMLRSEYEMFCEACRTKLDKSKFYFQEYRNTKGYRWGYGKIRRKDSLFLREYQEHMPYKQGIFIDIFPLDGVPDNYLLRSIKNFECFCVRKILWSEVGRIADRNWIKRKGYSLLAKLPEEAVWKYYQGMVKRANRKTTKMVRILTFPTPNKAWGYYRSWYKTSADIIFEGKVFQGIRAYDDYLRFKFGNYRRLPELENRKIHPVVKIRLPEERN